MIRPTNILIVAFLVCGAAFAVQSPKVDLEATIVNARRIYLAVALNAKCLKIERHCELFEYGLAGGKSKAWSVKSKNKIEVGELVYVAYWPDGSAYLLQVDRVAIWDSSKGWRQSFWVNLPPEVSTRLRHSKKIPLETCYPFRTEVAIAGPNLCRFTETVPLEELVRLRPFSK